MCREIDSNMQELADALENAANAYRNIAQDEMTKGYSGGSIDKVFDCVRNYRNLSNKARRVTQYNSTY